jgi:hypothetical protein
MLIADLLVRVCETVHPHASNRFQQFTQAIELVKKALVYAWMGDFEELEIQCYEMLGLSYFYLGDLKQSNFFHTKWSLAEVEPKDGYFKKVPEA